MAKAQGTDGLSKKNSWLVAKTNKKATVWLLLPSSRAAVTTPALSVSGSWKKWTQSISSAMTHPVLSWRQISHHQLSPCSAVLYVLNRAGIGEIIIESWKAVLRHRE